MHKLERQKGDTHTMQRQHIHKNGREIDPLSEGLCRAHADEREVYFDSKMPLRLRIPRRLGQACVLKLTEQHDKANKQIRKVRRELKQYKAQERRVRPRFLTGLMSRQYGDLILFDTNETALQSNRKEHYDVKVSRLDHAIRALAAEPKAENKPGWVGFINEMTVLTLFNRQMRPTTAAIPALFHNENGRDSVKNYDVLLLHRTPYDDEVSGHKIQVKSSESAASNGHEYERDIFVLCADRWLGYARSSNGGFSFPVADALIAEHMNSASDTPQREALDNVTEDLLFAVAEHQFRNKSLQYTRP